jgi:hypothetical protein
MINAPVLHVNGDSPEGESSSNFAEEALAKLQSEVARAMKIAFQYRNFFRKVG